ncbi:group III truncated hemoglobin [Weeksellaceae bacterium KMM 9713]|uniref:Group III truncated hemoglobin n=1 Tax=Profundicola chukchiensis TaxID=2961959 RepID=A0A9X4N2C5_9FLAO|nr:group III truncated hemoglobin [Profundicola chukchiensis]MDG4945369.1 group III truncated hemoglobin [Profundicola chukchiensis]MDG4950442.1 group III truncated hemoglobin [Profundicola chukchiensis]
MREIQNIEDIKLMVDSFYAKVRQDDLIGPIFDEKIQDRWPEHLEKMYTFWETVLLRKHTYFGSPFPPHAKLPVDKEHFERWLELFMKNLDEHFTGEKAEEAYWRAEKMANMFNYKINYIRENNLF